MKGLFRQAAISFTATNLTFVFAVVGHKDIIRHGSCLEEETVQESL